MKFENRTILITGGASGIGLALAKEFIRLRNTVIVCGRTESKLDEARDQVKELITYVCDVSDNNQVDSMLADFHQRGLEIDVLINNAAVIHPLDLTALHGQSLETLRREIDINLMSVISLSHKLLPKMQKRGVGTIINVSSPAGVVPVAQTPGYSLTKAAMHSYTQVLRHHFKDTDINIVELFPPSVETPMAANSGRKGISCEAFARKAIKELEKGKDEVWIGEGNSVRVLSKLPGNFIFNLVNKMVPVIKHNA